MFLADKSKDHLFSGLGSPLGSLGRPAREPEIAKYRMECQPAYSNQSSSTGYSVCFSTNSLVGGISLYCPLSRRIGFYVPVSPGSIYDICSWFHHQHLTRLGKRAEQSMLRTQSWEVCACTKGSRPLLLLFPQSLENFSKTCCVWFLLP